MLNTGRSSAFIIGCLFITVYAAPHVLPRGLVLPGAPWAEKHYSETIEDADKQAFSKTLPVIDGLSRIVSDGQNSRALFSLTGKYKDRNGKEHEENTLVMKVLHNVDKYGYAEVKALKLAGDFVDSGMLSESVPKLSKTPIPVIIMLRKPGQILSKTRAYRKANTDEENKLKAEAVDLMCKKVAHLAVTKKIYHGDNKEQNALATIKTEKNSDGMTVSSVTAIELVDWGAPGVYLVKDTVIEDEVYKYCKNFWQNVFVPLYR
ncbi:hypothetical protein BT96DRAFT_912532 [Gymnopus androsaceus JB14]|uniref:Protein kinase domain-containing protein n=1 Tax=Gymnopus androsaceus JB14 TaxID=1447944 RepID=A0A6A4IMQ8_9AGAR|nr:hypothetical protein BT96DRAFT_912532 [Gymnopus androsaceus JB14]